MKILRIIARLNVGGPARHVVWLTEGLKSAGYDTVLVAGVVPPGEDDMSYVAAAAGVAPLTLPDMSREISLRDALATWNLFRLMLRERPDIVHTHTAKAGTVGRVAGCMYRWLTPATLIGRPRRCRFVHTYHGHVFHSYYGPAKTRLFLVIEKLLARIVTDRIVVVSEQQRREINEVFRVGRRKQFVVIPLGIDMSAYANWQERRPRLRAELKAKESDLLVGIVGRLTEIKNHQMFLQAAARLEVILRAKGGTPRVRFVIVGDGSLRGDLESQAASLGLSADVVFLGTREDPESFYPALDILALSSLNEGTPLTLIEAMANARPVIATAVGGVVDLVGPASESQAGFTICSRGISVGSGDVEGFAHGLARLIEDRTLREELGERGRYFVAANYAKERLLSDMSNLYAQLVVNGSAASECAVGADETATGDCRARLTPRT
ncbi:MAG TPA: glycosyltransferase family 4 protein [Pyrinomonadaceae bacterium]|nr:glycosyltransferase family 4 protein [Pyrinomonadaceae bacterium]